MLIEQQTANGHFSTAQLYRSVLRSVDLYNAHQPLALNDLTPAWLKAYENYLTRHRGCTLNTTSTYLRCLQTIYNRAVQEGVVPYTPFQFHQVFTGVKRNHSRTLTASDIRRVIRLHHPRSAATTKARIYFLLMFGLQGLSFVDLAFLKKSDRRGNYIVLQRHKTGVPLRIYIPRQVHALLREYASTDPHSPYLLPILNPQLTGEALYRDYRNKLRRVNKALHRLAVECRLHIPLNSYCARHTWATLAKYCHIPVPVIAECLGHASPTTTEAYLKGYDDEVMAKANLQVMAKVRG
jgi:integrase